MVDIKLNTLAGRKSHTMYGEDSSGRKVSLLNDESLKNSSRPRLLNYSHRTRSSISSSMSRDDYTSSSSSISVSPGISPATPQLAHIDSLSTFETHSTPSPMTPNYHFDPLEHTKSSAPYYEYHRSQPGLNYPAMPLQQDASVQPYYHLPTHRMNDLDMDHTYSASRAALQPLQTRMPYSNPDPPISLSPPNSLSTSLATPVLPPSASSTPAQTTPTNGSAVKPIKKKYPCPHAARYACHDTFTTSGHAARHGKKHTGEKNILCPTCHKAFTRKDNMKQHERTHKSSRLEASSPTTSQKRISPSNSNSRRRGIPPRSRSASQPLSDPSGMDLDSKHMKHDYHSTHQSNHSQRTTRPGMARSELSEIIHNTTEPGAGRPGYPVRMGSMSGRSEEDGEGESPGLDALATAASEMVDA